MSSSRRGPGQPAPPEWEWANLVNRAETYLLEALGLGSTPAHAEAALAAAISRWQDLRRQPSVADGHPQGDLGRRNLRFVGSHDLSVELLGRFLSQQTPPVMLAIEFVGSLDGLIALAHGEADLAGAHLWDETAREFNLPFVQRVLPNRKVILLNLVRRLRGLVVPAGNPQGLRYVADLAGDGVRFVNRQPGSGTRVWLDIQLKSAKLAAEDIEGYDQEEPTHLGVARAVAEGRATAGLGISAAAAAYGLDFVPLGQERYDLVVPSEFWEAPAVQVLRAVVVSAPFKRAVSALGGYDVCETGTETHLD